MLSEDAYNFYSGQCFILIDKHVTFNTQQSMCAKIFIWYHCTLLERIITSIVINWIVNNLNALISLHKSI